MVVRGLVACVAAAALVVSGGTAASAASSVEPSGKDGVVTPMSAVGTQWISAFSYSWGGLTIPVPGGYLYHYINGSGLTFSESALYVPSSGIGGIWGVNICNWRIDFQNRRASNNTIASTSRGATHSGCSVINVSRSLSSRTVVQGVECARLYVNGVFRGEQCHSVY